MQSAPCAVSGPSRSLPGSRVRNSEWKCRNCRYINISKRERCKECCAEKDGLSEVPLKRTSSATLVLKALPPDVTERMIAETFQRYAEVKDVRYIESKKIAFIEFISPEKSSKAFEGFRYNDACLLLGSRYKAPSKISFADENRTKSSSAGDADWSTQVSIKQEAQAILMSCPALEPYNKYYTDRSREWLFDPETLYWYNYKTRSHYLLQLESQALVKVDKSTGDLCFQDSRALPEYKPLVKESLETVLDSQLSDKASKDRDTSTRHTIPQSVPGPVSISSVCYVCQRRFPSVEALRKHEMHSDLHKSNVANQAQPS